MRLTRKKLWSFPDICWLRTSRSECNDLVLRLHKLSENEIVNQDCVSFNRVQPPLSRHCGQVWQSRILSGYAHTWNLIVQLTHCGCYMKQDTCSYILVTSVHWPFNPLPTDASWPLWTLHKLMGIYMGVLILDAILQYAVSASFSCFLWLVKG